MRKQLRLTVTDLAATTGLSVGMLSKIENGAISPSLTTLQTLSRALGVPVTGFFRRFEEQRRAVLVKAGEGVELERRGTRAGHQYKLLGHIAASSAGVSVEPYLITLSTRSDTFPTFQHDGLEFLYMLEGEVVYRHGDQLFTLQPGDSLFFDADAPHGPRSCSPCRPATSRSSAIRARRARRDQRLGNLHMCCRNIYSSQLTSPCRSWYTNCRGAVWRHEAPCAALSGCS
ncbi:MAG: helix-turn-helix domain-containing protein [Geminicoccaceae bacterium]